MPTTIGIEYACSHLHTYHLSKASNTGLFRSSLTYILLRIKKERIDGTIRLRHQSCDDCLMQQDLELVEFRIRSLERELEQETESVGAMGRNNKQAIAAAEGDFDISLALVVHRRPRRLAGGERARRFQRLHR